MNSRPLKVFGITLHLPRHPLASHQGQVRAVVATTSQTAAARAFKQPVSYVRDYGSETGNAIEIAAAISKPGHVFIGSINNFGGAYVELVRD